MNGHHTVLNDSIQLLQTQAEPKSLDWRKFNREVLGRLDIASEARCLGVRFTKTSPTENGWLDCISVDRPDEKKPSAAINVNPSNESFGRYTDHGSKDRAISFFDLATKLKPDQFPTWQSARDYYAKKERIESPTANQSKRGGRSRNRSRKGELRLDQLTLLAWEPSHPIMQFAVGEWVNRKHGTTFEQTIAAGVRVVSWMNLICLAFPGYIPGDISSPCAVILYRSNGDDFPALVINGESRLSKRKTHLIAGSHVGLITIGKWDDLKSVHTVWKAEGITDSIALAAHLPNGHMVVTSTHGSKKFSPRLAEAYRGKTLNVLHDADDAGEAGARIVVRCSLPIASEVRHVRLPYPIEKKHGKDVRDHLNEGHTTEDIISLVEQSPIEKPDESTGRAFLSQLAKDEAESKSDSNELPEVTLPGNGMSITEPAKRLGKLLASTNGFFARGNVLVRLQQSNEVVDLNPVKPPSFCSDIEQVANLFKVKDGQYGKEIAPTICSESAGRLILYSVAFIAELPPITVLSCCPVVIDRGGQLIQISGYDRESGIWATGNEVPEIDLSEARRMLDELLFDFAFATKGDRARALAAFITPALVMGGLLRGRAPIDLGEADASQSGKGYRNKLITAIYGTKPKIVNQQASNGVGSLKESFDDALIRGSTFISLDNLRGKVDLPALESFATEDRYHARIPHLPGVEIDTRRVLLMMTSNRAEMTRDLVNRSSCVRIVKHPDNYKFRQFPEGDLLDHVTANQSNYLAAVFAVIREWHARGKPEAIAVEHDFRRWARVLTYIVGDILDAGPLLEGHRATQERIVSPGLNWLRDLTLQVRTTGKLSIWLRANQILEIIHDAGLATPGVDENTDLDDSSVWSKSTRAVGRHLGKCFREKDKVEIDHFVVKRRESHDSDGRKTKEYAFFPNSPNDPESAPNENDYSPNTRNGFEVIYGQNINDNATHNGAIEVSESLRGLRGRKLFGDCPEDADDTNSQEYGEI